MSIQSALDFIRAVRSERHAQGKSGETRLPCLEELLLRARALDLACTEAELIEAHRIDWKMRAFRLGSNLSGRADSTLPNTSETPQRKKQAYQKAVRDLYKPDYVDHYASLWNSDWPRKHDDNLRCIEDLLPVGGKWLDLCCGGGWHFGKIQTPCEMTGLDFSEAQLEVARKNNPAATLIQGDVLEVAPSADFDLVTCFWLAYGYLDDEDLIEEFCRRMVEWLKPGGNLIIEVADARAVHTWNDSDRGRQSDFTVLPRNASGSRWAFIDRGGVHRLTTPDYEFFDQTLGPSFHRFERRFTYHWCGVGKR